MRHTIVLTCLAISAAVHTPLAAGGHDAFTAGPAVAACGDSTMVQRRANESTAAFGHRIRPAGRELSHQVLEGNFGFTPRDVVALFGTREVGFRAGWVLTPVAECPGWYRRHVLPVDDISLVDVVSPRYQVRSVFRANADRDAARELVLILFAEGRGPADDNGDRTWGQEHNVAVMDWNGTEFVNLHDVALRLHNRPNAAAVRARLRRLGY